MQDKDIVIKLIEEGKETQIVDFKKEYYCEEKRYDIVKDVVAFANANNVEDSYIIFGIEDKTIKVCGVEEIPDISSINQILAEYVEPFIDVELGELMYEDKRLVYIKISGQSDKPYILKKEIGKGKTSIKAGSIYIRKGATNFIANRADLDLIYKNKVFRKVEIYRNYLDVNDWPTGKKKGDVIPDGRLEIQIKNDSNMPIIFTGGIIKIWNENGMVENDIHFFDSNLADNPLKISAKDEQVLKMGFSFYSKDCITLISDEEGNMFYDTKAQICLFDIDGNEYMSEEKNVLLTIRGCVLHKIESYYNDLREYLKRIEKSVLLCIMKHQNEKVAEYLQPINFKYLQPTKYMFDAEKIISCRFIRTALDNDNAEVLEIMKSKGLEERYIEEVIDNSFRINEIISKSKK